METDLEQRARKEIALAGGLMLKYTVPSVKGPPDNIVFWPCAVLHFVEFKNGERGRLEVKQREFHRVLSALGHHVYILTTFDEVCHYIITHGYRTKTSHSQAISAYRRRILENPPAG